MSGESSAFATRRVLWILAIGILAFAGLLLMLAYGPDLSRSRDGGGHALSISGIGYRGIVDLIGHAGGTATLLRDEDQLDTENLLVLTPDLDTDPAELKKRIAGRDAKPTLIVLPKWWVTAKKLHPGWVERGGMLPVAAVNRLIADLGETRVIDVPAPARPQAFRATGGLPATAAVSLPFATRRLAGGRLDPLLVDEAGRPVLAAIDGNKLYVLADPDILANHGLKDAARARAALALLDDLDVPGRDGTRAIAFDLTLNGLGRARNLLKLAFEPPFLALTLSLLGAALLAGLHAAARFGPAAREERAVALGKQALVDNVAALIVRAGREPAMGARYAALTAEAVAHATGAPARGGEAAVARYLDRLDGDGPRWSALAEAARTADDRASLLAAARALFLWRRSHVGDG